MGFFGHFWAFFWIFNINLPLVGAYIPIIDEMKNWPDKVDIQLPGCGALRALCYQNETFEEMLVNYDVVPTLVHSLQNCDDVDTLKECLLLVSSLLNVQHVRQHCATQVCIDPGSDWPGGPPGTDRCAPTQISDFAPLFSLNCAPVQSTLTVRW